MTRKFNLFTVMIALLMLATPSLRAQSSGTCGANVTWTLDDQGLLTISGTGPMDDCQHNGSAPWGQSPKKVVIESGVTSIGAFAFGSCASMTSIEIPNSVTSIGHHAFMYAGLTSVDIPNSVTSVGQGAFYSCGALTSIDIPSSVTSFPDYVFSNCSGLKSVNIPSSVTSIGLNAFYNCKGLTSIDIPNSVTSIGNSAFSDCSGLTSIDIPNSVTSIGEFTFASCSGLTSATIPSSVTKIDGYAFAFCEGLKKIESKAETPPVCGEMVFMEVGECVLYVPEKSIETYKSTAPWSDFSSIEALTSSVVDSGTCGDSLTWTLDSDGLLTISGTGAMTDYPSYNAAPWLGNTITKVVVGEGVTTIGSYAFYNCDGVTSADIAGTVTSIGMDAFSGCKGLTSVTVPNSVTSMGEGVFYKCEGLTNVTISNSLKEIAPYSFYECKRLTSANIPSSVTSIGENAFAFCEALTGVTIPDSVTSIGNNAYWMCKGLDGLNIPASVTSIGRYAFNGCSGLETITVDAKNSTYDSRDNCNALIETSTNTLLAGCKNTTVPKSVAEIGGRAFYNCAGLTSVTLPSPVTSVGDMAFVSCTGLTKMECQAVTPPACGDNVFYSVDFTNCTLSVPNKSIDSYKDAYGWKEFTNIEALADDKQSGTCGDSLTWTLDSDGLLTISGTGAMYDYSNSEEGTPWKDLSYTSVVIGDGVTTIGSGAFSYNSGLASVTIANSVTSIGEEAFYVCSGLKSITIPSYVTKIGMSAFNCCTGLEKIEALPVTPPACDTDAFYNVDINKCVLSVPEASIEKYKAADGWKEFYNGITGIDGVTEESNVGVSASNGVITVTGVAANTVVEVYSISGTLVYSGTSDTVAVPSAGVYVVKAAGKTVKVNAAR